MTRHSVKTQSTIEIPEVRVQLPVGGLVVMAVCTGVGTELSGWR